MSEREFYDALLLFWFALAAVLFVVLLRIPAPYGRHSRAGWGATLGARTGWFIMEAPASLLFALWFSLGRGISSTILLVFFVMWQAHYFHRAFIYPFTLGATARRVPVVVVMLGMLFNSVNTYLNGRYLFAFSAGYADAWVLDPRFVSGMVLFVAGYVLNRHSDWVLRRQRRDSGQHYCRIDRGLFRWVCCPNYLGEIVIWSGWALATWSLAGLSFAVWTAANLLPRARAHLTWSRHNIEAYPPGRKAVLPGIW